MPELVLYGIRLLAEHLLGTVLDMEVDQSGPDCLLISPTLTLGTISVSAILMQMFGWMIADPVCSIFIAVLIALSVGSLVADSMAILMQRSPKELDHSLPEAYQKVMQLEGVQGVHETHFWTLCTNFYCGGEDRPGRHRGSVE